MNLRGSQMINRGGKRLSHTEWDVYLRSEVFSCLVLNSKNLFGWPVDEAVSHKQTWCCFKKTLHNFLQGGFFFKWVKLHAAVNWCAPPHLFYYTSGLWKLLRYDVKTAGTVTVCSLQASNVSFETKKLWFIHMCVSVGQINKIVHEY